MSGESAPTTCPVVVAELTGDVLIAVIKHKLKDPPGPQRNGAILDALAYAVAIELLELDGFNGGAREYFNHALAMSFDEVSRERDGEGTPV